MQYSTAKSWNYHLDVSDLMTLEKAGWKCGHQRPYVYLEAFHTLSCQLIGFVSTRFGYIAQQKLNTTTTNRENANIGVALGRHL